MAEATPYKVRINSVLSSTEPKGKELPKHWQIKKLGEVFTIERGGSPRPIEDFITNDANGINWIKIGDTKDVVKYIERTKEKIKPEGAKRSRMVYVDDFLLSNSMSFGRPYIMKTTGCIHDGWLVIRKNETIDNNYLYYILGSNSLYQQFSNLAKGSTVKNLNIEAVKQAVITFPPLPEQQAIVAKIEELLSELENGIQQLLTAQQQLKVYRQSLLKWAFEGKLSESEFGGFKNEQDINTKSKSCKSSNSVNPDLDKGKLPKGWKWVKLSNLCLYVSDGDHLPPPKSKEGIPFITISNVKNNKIDFSDTMFMTEDYYQKLKENRKPKKGDILYTVTGSFGISVLIDFDRKFCFQRHIGLLRPLDSTNQKWLYYILQSPQIFKQASETATGTAQKTVALKSLRNFDIPLPSIEEQQLIVSELESKLTVCDKIEETISQSLLQAETLRQSILKKAFEGKLINNQVNP